MRRFRPTQNCTFALFGDMSRGYYFDRSSISFLRQLPFGVVSKVKFKHETARPLFEVHQPQVKDESASLIKGYTTIEAEFSLRFARDENFVQKNNRRVSLGMGK